MSFYLAIDAGGTNTSFVLADDDHELTRASTGTIKRMRVDEAIAAARLNKALQQLEEQANVSMSDITATCIGTAGNRVPAVAEWLHTALSHRVSGKLLLVGDVEIALDAAFRGRPGILVLAGTGSNVAARTAKGDILTTGGWGPQLAEQGSGHRIGLMALRAIFLGIDEQQTTSLLPTILSFWQLDSVDALVAYANATPPPDFSTLVRIVDTCAQQGDSLAQAILRQQGEELGHLVRILIRRMQAHSLNCHPTIAFAGSVMQSVHSVRDALTDAIRIDFPETAFLPGIVDPLQGALWRARQLGTS